MSAEVVRDDFVLLARGVELGQIGKVDDSAKQTPPDSSRVFINYRRTHSSGIVGALYNELATNLGEPNVFMDIDSIAPGVDFAETITEAIGGCDAVLVVIGKDWLTVRDGAGQPRLSNPDDFVRKEVESALRLGLRVIPVLVEGAHMPAPQELPESISELSRLHAFEVSDRSVRADVNDLIAAIQKLGTHDRVTRPALGDPIGRWDRQGNEFHVGDYVQVMGSARYGRCRGDVLAAGPDKGDGKSRILVRLEDGRDDAYTPSIERVTRLDKRGNPIDSRMDEVDRKQSSEGDRRSQTKGVFICYRREDSRWPARSLADALRLRLGSDKVFMDVDRVRLGNWRKQINAALAESAVVIVLIGPEWLNELGRREASKDEVRYEIAQAIQLGITMVPATLGRTEVPDRSVLPDEIAAFVDEEAYPLLEDKGWQPTVNILIDDIASELGASGDDD